MTLQDAARRRARPGPITADELFELGRLLVAAHDMAWQTDLPHERLTALTDALDLVNELRPIAERRDASLQRGGVTTA